MQAGVSVDPSPGVISMGRLVVPVGLLIDAAARMTWIELEVDCVSGDSIS